MKGCYYGKTCKASRNLLKINYKPPDDQLDGYCRLSSDPVLLVTLASLRV